MTTQSPDATEQVASAPKDGSTLLVQNAGGFGNPALVCWYRGEWRQVDYQGSILWGAVAIVSFDSWSFAEAKALARAALPSNATTNAGLVEAAYREGWQNGYSSGDAGCRPSEEEIDWQGSNTLATLRASNPDEEGK